MKTDVVLDLKDKKLMTNRGSEKIKFLKCANVNFTKVEDIEVTPKITEQFQEMLENRTGVFVEPNEALPYNTNFIGTIRTVNDDPIYSKLYPYPIHGQQAQRVTDYVPPIVNFERKFKIFIPTRTDWDNLPHQYENAVNIYKDGSKLNSQTGEGPFSPELDIKVLFRLPDHCSLFQAEVMAIQ